jgi:hypothetical protein
MGSPQRRRDAERNRKSKTEYAEVAGIAEEYGSLVA